VNYLTNEYYDNLVAKMGGPFKACKHIAERLGYQWRPVTIYNVIKGHQEPSGELIMVLRRISRKPQPRYRLTIEADTPEQLEAWKRIPMEERREMLNKLARNGK